jgi:hypothetical protein
MIEPNKTEVTKSPDETYIQKMKERFLQSFTSDIENEDNTTKWNVNIQPIFYLFDQYKIEVERTENTLEKQWRSKLLFENTPRGNIIMFYDAYKRGFSYYSDVFIPYNIINACAMKYVLTFFCRDFFIDETCWPNAHTSPFLRVHIIDPKKEKKKDEDSKFDASNGPFAKLKTTPSQKGVTISVRKSTTSLPQKELVQNKIIHLGKMTNFSFTKDKPIQSQCTNLGKINYRDFMGWQSPYATDSLFDNPS